MAESKHSGEGKECQTGEADLTSVTVVENENRRNKAISHFPKEVNQVAKDIASFFDAVADDASGGEDIVVSGPFALQSLVSAVRNNEDKVWFMEHQMLSADRIRELGVFEACGLVPFAENIDGDFLAAGQDDFRGTVHAVSAQGELEGRQEADCLADYLEAYRDMLLSHKLEYIEDCGMVEKSTDAESDNQHPRK